MMEVSLRFFIFLLTACVSFLSVNGNKGGHVHNTCVDTSANRTAPLGGSVTFTCKYPTENKSTSRYKFCKEDPNSGCSPLIETHQAERTKTGRFTLIEDKQRGVYNVTISTLTMEDTGRYQCVMGGSDRVCLTKVNLLILNWDEIKPTEQITETSNTARIMCYYPDKHESNEKFLCKGEDPFYCKNLINTTEGNELVSNGRFSIKDNRRLMYFFVNIQNLSREDSGTYWCGSDRTWQHDTFKKTLLTVVRKGKKSDPAAEKNATQLRDHSANKVVGVISPVAASLSMLLALVVVLLLVRRKLLRMRGGSSEPRTDVRENTEGNHEDHGYEEIEMQNQQANSGRTLMSVYSTVSSPSDQVHYASVVIQENPAFEPGVSTDDDTLPDTRKNDCDYSSISRTQGSTRPPPAESDLLLPNGVTCAV